MEGRLLVRQCAVWQAGAVATERSVVIEGDHVAHVGAAGELKALPGDWVVEARGRLLTPGLVDAWAGRAQDLARERLRIASALRQGVTCAVVSAEQAGPTIEAARTLGARAVLGLSRERAEPIDEPLARAILTGVSGEQRRPVLSVEAAWRCAPGSVLVDAPEAAEGGLSALTVEGASRGYGKRTGWIGWASGGRGRAWDAALMASRAGAAPSEDAVLFGGPGAWQEAVFGGTFGRVAPGATADLVLWEVVPGATFALGQLAAALAAWVVVAGRVVLREAQLVGADFVGMALAAR